MITDEVLKDVYLERENQNIKWKREPGVWDRPPGIKYLVLGEEVGEVARALLENDSTEHLYQELIQVAAVSVAWAESLKTKL